MRKKRRIKKKILIFLIIFMILVLIAGGCGFYLYRQDKERKEKEIKSLIDNINSHYSEIVEVEKESTLYELKDNLYDYVVIGEWHSIKKELDKYNIDDYKVETDWDEDCGYFPVYDYSGCDLEAAVRNQYYMPQVAAQLLNKDTEWIEDDFEVILEG